MNPRHLTNLQKVAAGKWGKLGKEEQSELLELGLVRIEYKTPEFTPAGTRALRGDQ